MGLVERMASAARGLREGRRRVYRGPQRIWAELRGGDPGDQVDAFVARVERSPEVAWARWNAPLERLVVAHRGDPEAALAAIREAEAALGLDNQPFLSDPKPHPADRTHTRRALARAAGNVASVGLGWSLRATGNRPRTMAIDLAALSAAFENLPQARRWVDGLLGGSRSDLVLGLVGSMTQALTQGSTGQVVDLVQRGLRLAEAAAERAVWEKREPELAGGPERARAASLPEDERPRPLPKGPIERYSDPAGMVSLGGFGFGVAATGQAEKAAASIFGTVPKAARVGREAFGAMLGRDLARRGFLILDHRVLRRLDRIDRVVLPHEIIGARTGEIAEVFPVDIERRELLRLTHRLFRADDPDGERADGPYRLALHAGPVPAAVDTWRHARPNRRIAALWSEEQLLGHVGVAQVVSPEVRAMVAHLRSAGLSLAVVSDEPELVSWCEPDRVVAPAQLRPELRSMQKHGHGVLLVATHADPAASAADLSLVLPRPDRPPAFGAHILAPLRDGSAGDPLDVVLMIDAIDAARRASRQSAAIAGADAAAGLVLSLQGQRLGVLQRIMHVSALASLGATANGARLARQVRPRGPVEHGLGGLRVPWHALEPAEACLRLQTEPTGLSSEEAARRQRDPPKTAGKAESFARAVWREMASPFAPVLATGAGLSALAGSPVDAGLVVGTVLASGLVSGWQQVAATEAMRELERARPSPVRVLRDGQPAALLAAQLVPGDVVLLEAGDRVPGDCRLLDAVQLEVDESSLTGESVPVSKAVAPSFSAALAERTSMLYADATIVAGRATAVVVALGDETETRRALAAAGSPDSGGVHARLAQLTRVTGPIAGFAAVSIVGMGLLRNRPAGELVDSAVSLAVAAVPETLPLLATAAQLAAARRLSAKGVLVRNVAAVEALGRVDVLCADKTGTLTEGILRLKLVSDGTHSRELRDLDDPLREILEIALHASPPADVGPVPHPTDRALLAGAKEAGVGTGASERRGELPFEPGRGYHATAIERNGRLSLCVKGAPEVVIALCAGDCAGRLAEAVALAERGLRVLAVAEGAVAPGPLEAGAVADLTFRGFLGIADPPRPQAAGAIASLRQAGVEVIMITGDHPATARAIARELGLDGTSAVLTGPELDRMTEDELDAVLPQVRVVARATPQLKVRIVAALQRAGRVVAMTGDGANDAPAIQLADVGVALGERATAAARGAADLLVTDERIETLVDAVLEGRAMWASVRDAVSTLVGGNIGELVFSLVGGLVDGRAPLGPRQLMLVNLLTDALPALMLATRSPQASPERLMEEGPDRSLGWALTRDTTWRATATATTTTAAWVTARLIGPPERASTVALLTLVGTQLGQNLWVGWRSPPLVAAVLGSGVVLLGIVQTPYLSQLTGSRPLGPFGLALAGSYATAGVLGAALLPVAWRWTDARVSLNERLVGLTDSDLGKLVTESRSVRRLMRALEAGAELPEDEEPAEALR